GACLEASVRHVFFPVQAADLKDSPSAQAVAGRHEAWKAELPKDDDALWDWLATLDDTRRVALLAEALDRADDPRAMLLVNAQSGRAAVRVPAPSVMLDDGEVERRVRLLRPMERTAMSLAALAHTHWERAERATFAEAWEQELAEIPDFTDTDLHIVTGLLLPIWKRLPDESMRVYRLQTDAGERVIGR